MEPAEELHRLDATTRFSDRADDYVRFRPDYPSAAIDRILAGFEGVAADVGAGTGISARALAERGVLVFAVEPNAAMRAAAAPHPRITWIDGRAEATGLPSSSVDLVVSAQAFHWFRHAEAITEFHRVLREGGRLALMWNARDRSDPLTRGYVEAIHAVNGEHPAERARFDPAIVAAKGEFAAPSYGVFPHAQRLDAAGLLGRATSASYVPKAGAALDALSRRLRELYERYREDDGRVTLRYGTEVWIADRLPRPI